MIGRPSKMGRNFSLSPVAEKIVLFMQDIKFLFGKKASWKLTSIAFRVFT